MRLPDAILWKGRNRVLVFLHLFYVTFRSYFVSNLIPLFIPQKSMSSGPETTLEDILKQLDEAHKAERQAIEDKHEAERLAVYGTLIAPGLPSSSSSLVPLPLSASSPATITSKRRRKRQSKTESEVERPSIPTDRRTLISLFTGEESESEDEVELYVQRPLPKRKFDHEDLREHLKTYEWTEAGEILLEEVVVDHRLKNPAVFHQYSPEEEKQHHAHYTVFDVGNDGSPLNRRRAPCLEEKVDNDGDIWNILKVRSLFSIHISPLMTCRN